MSETRSQHNEVEFLKSEVEKLRVQLSIVCIWAVAVDTLPARVDHLRKLWEELQAPLVWPWEK